ncbi:FIST signal transduction protein [Massilia sp. DWR3-1-1]|uniref:FIST signal transduction protein n=1 Tax=Massilia sp. DWR3-1-1 TaxID=2804559 RepID=UPI003CE8C806
MQIQQSILAAADVARFAPPPLPLPAQLLLAFAAPAFFADDTLAARLRVAYPQALIVGCSTAGEIAGNLVHDERCVLTALAFEHTSVRAVSTVLGTMADSAAAGAALAAQLPHAGLAAVLLLGTGVAINGSALVAALEQGLPPGVPLSGGLAADGGAFARTWTLGPGGRADDQVVAVGLYGSRLALGHGSYGGWRPFGPSRKITRAVDNVLYELDGERALDIYKAYLGSYAADLPASGLLFPFELQGGEAHGGVIRTILGTDDASGSLILAGNVEVDGTLRLMHADTEKLIDGAETAARRAAPAPAPRGQALAILVSCVGRRLVMGDRIDEEVEAVAAILGADTLLTGFYSNGEIAAPAPGAPCRLHNQTMTITVLGEY